MCVHFFRPEDEVVSGIDELDRIIPKERLDLSPLSSPPPVPFDLRPNITLDAYLQMINAARGYISRGDVYQVNLSQRLSAPSHSSLDPHLYFRFLYEAQPVPYAALINCPGFTLVSGSMELFLEKRGRTLVTKPIKGTRKRGVDSREDKILRNELLSSPKERAENLMIVDLMRNDLSKVAIPGSVEVKSLFRVKAYHTVQQMVSVVSGELREGIKTADILRATFPPGSVTGAPKRRAVEIISELEPHARGPYCGAVGVFYPNGDIRLSVAIRVAAISEAGLDCWVGGGIVWDSEPELEYEEALIKARAVKSALLRLRK